MSAPNDFSRRFFADFIASRIKARGMEKDGIPIASPTRHRQCEHSTSNGQ